MENKQSMQIGMQRKDAHGYGGFGTNPQGIIPNPHAPLIARPIQQVSPGYMMAL
jgi:hypothetical protein